jgi:hypothetical protein
MRFTGIVFGDEIGLMGEGIQIAGALLNGMNQNGTPP